MLLLSVGTRSTSRLGVGGRESHFMINEVSLRNGFLIPNQNNVSYFWFFSPERRPQGLNLRGFLAVWLPTCRGFPPQASPLHDFLFCCLSVVSSSFLWEAQRNDEETTEG